MSCIYGFVDRNGKIFYVGQTTNIKNRLREHKNEVEKGNKLYCYNKLRKEMRETRKSIQSLFTIIEDNVEKDKLDKREIYHIRVLRLEGYKLTNLTDGGRGAGGYSKSLQKRCAKSRIGRRFSEETKRKMSQSRIGMKFSDKHKKNLSLARQKRITTDETRQKMSESSKGRINIKKYILTDPNGIKYITYQGLTKFCEEHGLTAPNLHKVLKKERSTHKGWSIEAYNGNDNRIFT